MRFFDEAADEFGMRVFEGLLHEGDEHDVAFHLDVFAEVEPLARNSETEFSGLFGFARERTPDGPFCFYVEAERGVNVGLEAFGEVVETGVVAYGAGC